MSGRSIILLLVLAGFGVVSALALLDVGYLGILAPLFHSWGGAQVLADFVILAVLGCVWMAKDARERGLPAWPFILMTALLGSFGVLAYLLVRDRRAAAARPASA